jgi:hypothetical protein
LQFEGLYDIVTDVTRIKIGMFESAAAVATSVISDATLKVFTKRINVQRYRPNFLQVGIETKGGIRSPPVSTRSTLLMCPAVPSLRRQVKEGP